MSTFGTIKARINDELGRSEVVGRIPNAVLSARRFYESQRFWFLEGEATASTVADQQDYDVPSDFLEADQITLTKSNIRYPLKRRPWSWLRYRNIDTVVTSQPWNWSYYCDQIWLWPVPDEVYTLQISYLKRLTALSADADTDDWLTHGEELVRNRALYELCKHPTVRDFEAAAVFKSCTDEAFKNLRSKSEQKISTGRLSLDDALAGDGAYNISYQ